jgi:hypothetical protein
MKWIFIFLASGILAFMAYSTYSTINTQLQSSAIGKPVIATPEKVTVEKIEGTVSDVQNPTK